MGWKLAFLPLSWEGKEGMVTHMCENKPLLFSSSDCAKISPVKWVKWVGYCVMVYWLFGCVSWFTLKFHIKLVQLVCPSPDEDGGTGSFHFNLSSTWALTYNSCTCRHTGCSPFHPVFPDVKGNEQLGGERNARLSWFGDLKGAHIHWTIENVG